MSILQEIAAATRLRVERDKRSGLPAASTRGRPPFCFEQALSQPDLAFICEVKQASPSKGLIAADFDHLQIARDYAAAGATALSVLTEPDYFLGSDQYLLEIGQTLDLPLLRKDFIIDSWQIEQAAALGADAVLLIVALLADHQLTEFLKCARQLGLSSLVEVHDAAELERALAAGAGLIGINNRDLSTFQVDTANSIRLRQLVPTGRLVVAESGIQSAADVAELRAAGFQAVLIGEVLMRAADKRQALAELRGDHQ